MVLDLEVLSPKQPWMLLLTGVQQCAVGCCSLLLLKFNSLCLWLCFIDLFVALGLSFFFSFVIKNLIAFFYLA